MKLHTNTLTKESRLLFAASQGGDPSLHGFETMGGVEKGETQEEKEKRERREKAEDPQKGINDTEKRLDSDFNRLQEGVQQTVDDKVTAINQKFEKELEERGFSGELENDKQYPARVVRIDSVNGLDDTRENTAELSYAGERVPAVVTFTEDSQVIISGNLQPLIDKHGGIVLRELIASTDTQTDYDHAFIGANLPSGSLPGAIDLKIEDGKLTATQMPDLLILQLPSRTEGAGPSGVQLASSRPNAGAPAYVVSSNPTVKDVLATTVVASVQKDFSQTLSTADPRAHRVLRHGASVHSENGELIGFVNAQSTSGSAQPGKGTPTESMSMGWNELTQIRHQAFATV